MCCGPRRLPTPCFQQDLAHRRCALPQTEPQAGLQPRVGCCIPCCSHTDLHTPCLWLRLQCLAVATCARFGHVKGCSPEWLVQLNIGQQKTGRLQEGVLEESVLTPAGLLGINLEVPPQQVVERILIPVLIVLAENIAPLLVAHTVFLHTRASEAHVSAFSLAPLSFPAVAS